MVFGEDFMVILILESGRVLRLKVMGSIIGKMGIGMKASGSSV